MKKNNIIYFSTICVSLGILQILLYLLNLLKIKQNNIVIMSSSVSQIVLLLGILFLLIGFILKVVSYVFITKSKKEELIEEEEYKKCKNCNLLVPLSTYICPNCNKVTDSKQIKTKENVKDKEYIENYYKDDLETEKKEYKIKKKTPRLLLLSFIFIVVIFIFILNMNFKSKKENPEKDFIIIVEEVIENIRSINIDKKFDKTYITFKQLDLNSQYYDNESSFLIVDGNEKFIILKGYDKYNDYGIEFLNINDKVEIVHSNLITVPLNNKLLIDKNNKIIIYEKNNP